MSRSVAGVQEVVLMSRGGPDLFVMDFAATLFKQMEYALFVQFQNLT